VRPRFPMTVLVMALGWAVGCGRSAPPAAKSVEPAKVAHHVTEESLNTITLAEEAVGRLGIRLADVELAEVQRKRTVGGEVVVPTGRTIVVSAPVAGTLSAPGGAAVPAPGSSVAAGQPLFRFEPLLSPERDVLTPAERVRVAQTRADVARAQIEAEQEVESAKVAVDAAQIAYDRAVQLLRDKAGSQRSVDEAEASLRLALAAQKTAEARFRFLSEVNLDEQAGELASRTIESPVGGILQSVEAAVGETVTAGEPLFSVVKIDRVWVRVPVYVGHFRDVDTAQAASVAEYGQEASVPPRSAKYVSAPPSANPNATTADLFYEMANDDGHLVPGQKVSVTLPVQGRARKLVVPFSAVVYDVLGGAWVYERIEDRVFVRRRVSVEYVDGANAVLAAGPAPGARVVTDGAVELFGTEFGVGH